MSKLAERSRSQSFPDADGWNRVLAQLRAEVGDDSFNSWLARAKFEQANHITVQVSVPTRFLKQWVAEHYYDRIVELWHAAGHPIQRVELLVRSAVRQPARPSPEPPKNEADRPLPTMLPHVQVQAQRRTPQPQGPLGGSPVDARFSFETFCEGAANRVALAAARVVAETPVGAPAPFNPLFIHAGVGRGKTHLLHAIAQAARHNATFRNAVYVTAEHFMFRFVAAIRSQSGIAFKESLREIDLLLIDDVQFLQGKSTQTEFCHLINTLIDDGRQVVVAADRPPTELESLDERVRSRLGGGVAFEIGLPDLELRRRILKSRLAAARAIHAALEIPDIVLEYVAQTVISNGRDLEGALNRLVAQYQFTSQPVTMASAEVTLRDLIGTHEPRRVRIEDIQKAVAVHFGVSKADLLSSRRTRTIVRPRQIAMYLSKAMTPRSLPEIGRRFGGRDHTTVLHAVRKIEELMRQDRQLAEQVEMLRRMIEDQAVP